MILLFDVGNTTVGFGISDGINILETYKLNTEVSKTADEYWIQMRSLIPIEQIDKIAISSVVPRITEKLKEISEKHFKLEPLIIGPG
ncbi:MAG TPA: type III pantothenate kinase, partial [Acholeplasmataceae bacterium]|nr:type III pantothenate kinase [Acholeplasmataceae bacterium]